MTLSRRQFVAACASLLYGAPRGFATEATPGRAPQIGMLLPLASAPFGDAAESVRRGMEAATRHDTGAGFDITIYSTSEDPANVLAGYRQALAAAPRLILGPITRNGVTALVKAYRPGTPVIALNVPDIDTPLPEDFYVFSLQVETEARQAAHMAFGDGRRSAITLADEQPIVRRIQRAFVDEFNRQGGRIVAQLTFRGSDADLAALRDALAAGGADMAFIALDKTRARLARRYLEGLTHVYATSEILEATPDRAADAQLDGVRFVAMPWLVQRDHPAVMIYAGANTEPPGASDGERLYAFGIDAYRIAAAFLRGTDLRREPLDGVTGRIMLGRDRHFARELTPAQFVGGRVQPLAPRA